MIDTDPLPPYQSRLLAVNTYPSVLIPQEYCVKGNCGPGRIKHHGEKRYESITPYSFQKLLVQRSSYYFVSPPELNRGCPVVKGDDACALRLGLHVGHLTPLMMRRHVELPTPIILIPQPPTTQ